MMPKAAAPSRPPQAERLRDRPAVRVFMGMRPEAVMCRKLQRRSGFTLVEILGVLVIIGIASAMVIPHLGTRDDLKASAAARVVIADLIYAQSMAISSSSTYYVRFDTGTNSYKVLSNASPSGDTVASNPLTQLSYVQTFGSGSKFDTIVLQSATINGTDAAYQPCFTVAFDEMGAPYAYSYTTANKNDLNSGSIVVKSGNFTKTITISPYTGEISVN
jgi:prepilin-type N-terminal cleavage/methylation domain-containing protein